MAVDSILNNSSLELSPIVSDFFSGRQWPHRARRTRGRRTVDLRTDAAITAVLGHGRSHTLPTINDAGLGSFIQNDIPSNSTSKYRKCYQAPPSLLYRSAGPYVVVSALALTSRHVLVTFPYAVVPLFALLHTND